MRWIKRTGVALCWAAVVGISVFESQIALGAPGELDRGFRADLLPSGSWVVAMAIADGRPVIQTSDGAVRWLTAGGETDVVFPSELPAMSDRAGDPPRALHAMPDGSVLATHPPRILGADGTVIRQLVDSTDPLAVAVVTAAPLADGSVLLGDRSRLRVRILPDGSQASVNPSVFLRLDSDISWNRLLPAGEGRWFVLGDPQDGIPGNLRRLTADGRVDSTFQPVDYLVYGEAVAAAEGKVYVAHGDEDFYQIARLLEDGRLDQSFQPKFAFGHRVTSLVFDPVMQGVFVGRDRSDGYASLSLATREGELDSYTFNYESVRGSVSDLALSETGLYVVGDLVTQESREALSEVVRLDVRGDTPAPPIVWQDPKDAVLPNEQFARITVDVITVDGRQDYQWFRDGQALVDETGPELKVRTTYETEGLYHVEVTGTHGLQASRPMRLRASGLVSELDPDFAQGFELGFTPYRQPWTETVVLSDGKVFVSGAFDHLNGEPFAGSFRLTSEGALDRTFPIQKVRRTRPVSDALGNLYGYFEMDSDEVFGRLSAEGEFVAIPAPEGFAEVPGLVARQATDGKLLRVLVVTDGEQGSKILHRFDLNGVVDETFSPVNLGASGRVATLTMLASGKILMTGVWSRVNGHVPSAYLTQSVVRLDQDGAIDESFDASGFSRSTVARQVVATSSGYAVWEGERFLKLTPRGEVDPSFEVEVSSSTGAIAIDAAERLYAPSHYRGFQRFLPDGTLDAVLPATGRDWVVQGMEPHLDGLLLASDINGYDGVPLVNQLARLRPIDAMPITFADVKLEAALQDVLGLGQAAVTVGALSSVEALSLDGLGITDVRGLENAFQLTSLSINDNRITDFTPLKRLPIVSLSAEGNPTIPEMAVPALRLQSAQDGRVVLAWQSEIGRLYFLESSRDLRSWRLLPNLSATVGDGAVQQVTLERDERATRYYRLLTR